MYRVNKVHVRKSRSQFANRQTQLPERLAETLAPMRGNQYETLVFGKVGQRTRRPVKGTRRNVVKGVDHRVSGDEDVFRRTLLFQQCLPCAFGRSKVKVRHEV